MSNSSLISW